MLCVAAGEAWKGQDGEEQDSYKWHQVEVPPTHGHVVQIAAGMLLELFHWWHSGCTCTLQCNTQKWLIKSKLRSHRSFQCSATGDWHCKAISDRHTTTA